MLLSASRSVARRWGPGHAARNCLPSAVVVVAAIHRAATPGPERQIWLPRPSVLIGGGPAVGSPFGAAARSASSGKPPVNGPRSKLLVKLGSARSRRQVAPAVDQLVDAGVLANQKAMTTVLKVIPEGDGEKQAHRGGDQAPPPQGRPNRLHVHCPSHSVRQRQRPQGGAPGVCRDEGRQGPARRRHIQQPDQGVRQRQGTSARRSGRLPR